MGARKAQMAERLKAEKKQKAIAIMRDCPTSPRKMRLVADIIRGVEINKALGILRYSKKEAYFQCRLFASKFFLFYGSVDLSALIDRHSSVKSYIAREIASIDIVGKTLAY